MTEENFYCEDCESEDVRFFPHDWNDFKKDENGFYGNFRCMTCDNEWAMDGKRIESAR